ncbi:LysR family transcriptional regulator [Enterobacteriaceae bacterium RIT697]|uniref:LysR family transcriptional regulator n=1 Tax=Pantoea endophytica TaxID=92488 RepID=UPI0012AE82C0|nr:LysR family transcriptional regulator [Pantoea endophytica]MRT24952.1 LysR family transcriptional regulator [Enterobacteriaceae bacterium RIT697]
MTTFRELEAFVAVVDMGSFKGAAKTLNTSQSAISRLIREFEDGFEQPLFDRGKRSSQVTMTGLEVLHMAREILRQRNRLTERFGEAGLIAPTLRLGVTELAVMTWLPACIVRLKSQFPKMHLEIETGTSAELHAQLHAGKLDVAMICDIVRSQDMIRVQAGTVNTGWYCNPSLNISDAPTVKDIEENTLLLQPATTSTGSIIASWMSEHGVRPKDIILTDNLTALREMASCGVGIACLPELLTDEMLRKSKLRRINLPVDNIKIGYVFIVKIEEVTNFHRSVIEILKSSFEKIFTDEITY